MNPKDLFNHVADKYGRRVVFFAQVGSVNYNLQTEDSDEDFELFLLPNFSDLYSRRDLADQFEFEGADVKVFFVTHLVHQLQKSNPNFMQLLFSKRLFHVDPEFKWLVQEADYLSLANLPRLYASWKGMFYEAKGRLERSFGSDQMNGKALMQAHRSLDFLDRFHRNVVALEKNEFDESPYKDAMTYKDDERAECLSLKRMKNPGNDQPLTRKEVDEMVLKYTHMLDGHKHFYLSRKVDDDALEYFRQKMEKSVKASFDRHYS